MIAFSHQRTKLNSRSVIQWLTAIWFFLTLYPYFVWSIESYSLWLIQMPLLLLLLSHRARNIDITSFMGFALICLWGAICGGANLFGILSILTASFIFITDELFLIDVFKKYRSLFVILIGFSLVSYILVTIGVSLPYHVSPPPPRNTIDHNYYIYPFYACPSVDDWRNLGINRFNGLFDEPGVVGTISFIILFIDHFDFKKIGNIILLVAGIMSFSLFFYLALLICLGYKIIVEKVKFRTKFLFGVFVAAVIFFSFSNEVSSVMIWDRLVFERETNTISGDNRSSESLKTYINNIRWTSTYFFGEPEMVEKFQDSASLEKQILAHGFITVFMFFLFFAKFSKKRLNNVREWILFYIVFFIMMYNRPSMFSLGRLMLYIIAIFAYSEQFSSLFYGDKNETPEGEELPQQL